MRMNSLMRTLAIGAVAVALLAPSATAVRALMPADVAKLEARLNLTPEQRAATAPIIQRSQTARGSTFQKYGVDLETCKRPGALGLIRLNKDMKRINADARARLAEILSAEQLREYDKIVAEQTAAVKKQIMC